MLNKKILQNAITAIVKAVNPSKIIIFGSYAREDADEGSDIDLLVIEDKHKDKGLEMVKIRNAIGDIGIGVDVLVYSEKDIKELGHLRSSTLYWALKDGKILYEKPLDDR